MAEFLIQSGASVDKKSVDGWTALHLTCGSGHVDVIDLLRQGADRAMNKSKYVLDVGIQRGTRSRDQLLLKYGAESTKLRRVVRLLFPLPRSGKSMY